MPVYNREKHVVEAVDSVLAQTYPFIELIAIDDGSTDGSLAVLNGYGHEITVLSQEHRGQGAAGGTLRAPHCPRRHWIHWSQDTGDSSRGRLWRISSVAA